MADTVIQQNSGRETGIDTLQSRPLFSDSADVSLADSVPVVTSLSETQAVDLRPEFTEALVQHMHEAKRLAILDHRE